MTYEELSNRNMTEGMHVLFLYLNDVTGGIFIMLFLLSFFLIIFLGGSMTHKRTTGQSNVPAYFAVAGILTFVLTVLLSMISGLISGAIFGITLSVAILGGIWLMLDNRS